MAITLAMKEKKEAREEGKVFFPPCLFDCQNVLLSPFDMKYWSMNQIFHTVACILLKKFTHTHEIDMYVYSNVHFPCIFYLSLFTFLIFSKTKENYSIDICIQIHTLIFLISFDKKKEILVNLSFPYTLLPVTNDYCLLFENLMPFSIQKAHSFAWELHFSLICINDQKFAFEHIHTQKKNDEQDWILIAEQSWMDKFASVGRKIKDLLFFFSWKFSMWNFHKDVSPWQ
jgi:hypothetical protein